jgi:putative glutamine amidotransferase
MRALIAVPTYPRLAGRHIKPWHDDGVAAPARYIDALRRADAMEAMFLPLAMDEADAKTLLGRVDGLMLLGGGDVDPDNYGAEHGDVLHALDADRDACEIALARSAVAEGIPVLAICRGHQVLNVALGGHLDQDIAGRDDLELHGRPGEPEGGEMREVTIEPGTRLAEAMGTTVASCSCHHHQAVIAIGQGLRAVAHAEDGVIEATELADEDAPWVVSVQWHPEDTADRDEAQHGLFATFVEHASRRGRTG